MQHGPAALVQLQAALQLCPLCKHMGCRHHRRLLLLLHPLDNARRPAQHHHCTARLSHVQHNRPPAGGTVKPAGAHSRRLQ